jgi:hypothetical protein
MPAPQQFCYYAQARGAGIAHFQMSPGSKRLVHRAGIYFEPSTGEFVGHFSTGPEKIRRQFCWRVRAARDAPASGGNFRYTSGQRDAQPAAVPSDCAFRMACKQHAEKDC